MGKRTFGAVRQLPSGLYQARYVRDGVRYVGPKTYDTKADANASFLGDRDPRFASGSGLTPTRVP
jgi:hypothetical protein